MDGLQKLSTSTDAPRGSRRPGSTRAAKRERQRRIRDIVASRPIHSQHELVELLSHQGVEVTQATVSRDIGELGLVKIAYDGTHIYASAEELGPRVSLPNDERLRRVLADYPVTIGRSGLTLLLISEAGTAGAIAQAIDDSTLREQEGTLAGDNTILVLFRDEPLLEGWLERFATLLPELSMQGYR